MEPTTAPPDLPDLVVIYRGLAADAVGAATEAILAAGPAAFEVTLNTPGALASIAALRDRFGYRAPIGAGTVTTTEDVKAAADAGASFLISPHLDPEVVAATKEAGLISIPGAFTPTELVRARAAGADLVKLFPVAPAGGAAYVRQVRAPLADIPLLAVGGVTAALGRECLRAGCAGVGVGIRHIDEDAVRDGDWAALTAGARRFMAGLRA
jgi:2-dehydro-3-deoxyphosphogluconate aldolase/(4S)-4-hydroxy-2-oxoglutarate aldolase